MCKWSVREDERGLASLDAPQCCTMQDDARSTISIVPLEPLAPPFCVNARTPTMHLQSTINRLHKPIRFGITHQRDVQHDG